jgi:hypothetical protein
MNRVFRMSCWSLEPQRIGERVGDQRFRQSMSFAVRSRATARAN